MSTSTRARDTNKTRVYTAQTMVCSLLDDSHNCPTVRLAGSTITLPVERKFADLQSMQAYVSRIAPGVLVRSTRTDAKSAHYEYATNTIAIPLHRSPTTGKAPWATRELVLLHELAHRAAPGGLHDAEFCQAFISLVRDHCPPELAFLLEVTFRESGLL